MTDKSNCISPYQCNGNAGTDRVGVVTGPGLRPVEGFRRGLETEPGCRYNSQVP
jgi:hypothetical protein